jgi:hypothetical protein
MMASFLASWELLKPRVDEIEFIDGLRW